MGHSSEMSAWGLCSQTSSLYTQLPPCTPNFLTDSQLPSCTPQLPSCTPDFLPDPQLPPRFLDLIPVH